MNNAEDLFDGIAAHTKVCGICKQSLPVGMFGKDGGSNYLRYECKPCARKQSKIVSDLKKVAPAVPANHRCHICQMSEQEIRTLYPNKKSIWCCDHDHKTNSFRGWLCHKCNLALGNLNDDIARLERALDYLKRSIT